MQWMARGSNGGYFEMMGGGWLIHRGSLLPDPREPSLAPNPRLFASQHVQSSKSTQPSCQPGHLQNLSSNLSSCGAHQVATTPMYLFSTQQCAETHPNPLCIVCEGIHYLSTDLSIPPPICPYYPPDRPRVIALLILSPRPANFKILQHSKLKIIRHNQFPWLQFLHQNRNHSNSPPHLNLSTNTSWI